MEWSLVDVARRVGVGYAHLARLFRRHTGTTLLAWRTARRLEVFFRHCAAAGPRPNLLHAAHAAGFGSYAQFHRVFTARFRRSPRVWLRGG